MIPSVSTPQVLNHRFVAAAAAITLITAACGSDDEAEPAADASAETSQSRDGAESEPDGTATALTRDDVDCSSEGLGEDDRTSFVAAHYVVDGRLGELCFGEEQPTLVDAWETLATITPELQLADLGLFAAVASDESGDEVTLAFVNTLDSDGTLFQMSVNLDAYVEDLNEAQLTMAHEFSHVFAALPSQIDRSAEAEETCSTYFNGEGCYTPDSIMAQWIEEFWGEHIDEVDPFGEATADEGQSRCDEDAGFFGAYGASNPEEDFAEAFSAFVFQVPAAGPEQQARYDWMADQPGLVEFRDRAVAAGAGPLPNNFDECGLG